MRTRVHTSAVNHWIHLAIVYVLLSLAGVAEAQRSRIYTPGLGLGVGSVSAEGDAFPAVQIDFALGYERQTDKSRGFMLRLDFLSADNGDELDVVRFDIAPMLTWGSTGDEGDPYYRWGAGPLLALASVSREGRTGLGVHGELAVGLRNYVELYADARIDEAVEITEDNQIALLVEEKIAVGTVGLRITSYEWTRFVLEVLAAILD
jgi:hypothetical protein